MSREAATQRAHELRDWLYAYGFPTVSIELRTGRSGGWNAGRFVACLGHHTVSRPTQGATPILGLVKYGRYDLPGPLAGGYLGYDLIPRIITMDWANHAGRGGPWTVPGYTIPRDNGRPYIFGWEHEGGIHRWTSAQRSAMARCHAATLSWLGRDARSYGEHFTWSGPRKIDRLGYTTAIGRREVAAAMAAFGQEGDMSDLIPAMGDEGDHVIEWQQGLWDWAHGPGGWNKWLDNTGMSDSNRTDWCDGEFGDQSRDATIYYQRQVWIAEDGEAPTVQAVARLETRRVTNPLSDRVRALERQVAMLTAPPSE